MRILADLQLHSKYSRAVSPAMVIPKMYEWNLKKGIGLLATGDWTHPQWLAELKRDLVEQGNGLLKIHPAARKHLQYDATGAHGDPLFLLSGEVSCIYTHNGKARRNHLLLFAPSFKVVEKINTQLIKRGCNISSDGRPILGLSSQEICELVWTISEEVLVIPAHAWTPWFSVFGSISGYDSLAECFGPFADRIYAVETGLSSNPAMNWRIKELDTRSIVSFSDAHSGSKMMREATLFETGSSMCSFADISAAIRNVSCNKSLPYIAATIEFYPEEGKYHFDGHRSCLQRMNPIESKRHNSICPRCGRRMTIGVLSRIEQLADRTEAELHLVKKKFENTAVEATYSDAFPHRPPYIMTVPLQEIIAHTLGVAASSKKVELTYTTVVTSLGGEYTALIKSSIRDIEKASNRELAENIEKVRIGDIVIEPGYDGVYGTVEIRSGSEGDKKQLNLF